METLQVTRIEKKFNSYGHNEITITVTGKQIPTKDGEFLNAEDLDLKCISNNTMAIDVYFDNCFDEDLENEDGFYETRYDAGESLVEEVLACNDIKCDFKILNIPTAEDVKRLRDEIKNHDH